MTILYRNSRCSSQQTANFEQLRQYTVQTLYPTWCSSFAPIVISGVVGKYPRLQLPCCCPLPIRNSSYSGWQLWHDPAGIWFHRCSKAHIIMVIYFCRCVDFGMRSPLITLLSWTDHFMVSFKLGAVRNLCNDRVLVKMFWSRCLVELDGFLDELEELPIISVTYMAEPLANLWNS